MEIISDNSIDDLGLNFHCCDFANMINKEGYAARYAATMVKTNLHTCSSYLSISGCGIFDQLL